MSFSKLLVVGLDSAAPALVFERWRNELPTIADLIARGAHARLVSTNPPLPVPAWTAMVSSHDPGELGFYGFRNRKDHSYDGYAFANSALVKVPRLWDWLGSAGLRCLVLGVPQTYPPSPLNGEMVSCFLTPSTGSAYTYPPDLKAEVERVTDGYVLDVEDFRTADKAGLLERVYRKTEKHLTLAKHLVRTRPWDFCMLVEMGVDRIHHGFWSYMDPAHHRYERGNPFESAILDYYRYVDRELAELLAACPSDTLVAIGSTAYRPEDIYRAVNGVAPDLIVYFGDLDWRSVGAVGMGGIHTSDNDTGPDEANHDWYGIFVLSTAGAPAPLRGALPDVSIYDVAPTLLHLLGQPVPEGLTGRPLV